MTFAAPGWLFGLLGIAAALVLYVVARRGMRARRDAFAAPAVQAAVSPSPARWRAHVAPLLYALAAAALVVALARPQRSVAVPVEQATVVLVTDHSRSMQATDIAPDRMAAARRAAATFLDQVPATIRVGSVVFNQHAKLLQVPTTDRASVRGGLAALQPFGGTATGEGLALGLAAARGGGGAKPPPAAIILLTDGRSSSGRDPLIVARDAKAAGIPIHTVALGTSTGRLPDGRTATADTASLQAIAALSGGRFSTAGDAASLQAVYKNLGSRIATRHQRRETTAAFAGGGLLLLLVGAGSSLLLFGRLP